MTASSDLARTVVTSLVEAGITEVVIAPGSRNAPLSFAAYGVLRKQASVGAVEGLTVETLVMAPVALAFLLVLQGVGQGDLVWSGPRNMGDADGRALFFARVGPTRF